jgi:hypothetical protein
VLEDRLVPTTWFVSTQGSDGAAGTATTSPLASIQHAVNLAQEGDTILVAKGAYGYNAAADNINDDARFANPANPNPPSISGGVLHINPAVVLLYDKSVLIYGGFNNSFTVADPLLYHTVIEGNNTVRGVYVLADNRFGQGGTGLVMSGITIEQGLGQAERGLPAATSVNDRIFGYGGGMWINDAQSTQGAFTLQDMVFYKNRAIGFNTNGLSPDNSSQITGAGGTGAGGGLAVRDVTNMVLHRVTFSENQALGGTGDVRGGSASGAGLQADKSTVTGDNLIFVSNLAQAGNSGGNGADSTGQHADGLGGAAAIQSGTATLQQVTAYGNAAVGGNAATQGGNGKGGAFLVQAGTFTLTDASLRSNLARGGTAQNGGLSGGGALDADGADVTLNRVQVLANVSQGGGGTGGNAGPATGGGIALVSASAAQTLHNAYLTNCVFGDNAVLLAGAGNPTLGGGGGAWFQGVSANLTFTTFAENVLGPNLPYGQAMLLLDDGSVNGFAPQPTVVTLTNSIVANHTNTSGASAIHVRGQSGHNTITYNHVLNANNTRFDNSGGTPADATGVGTINGAGTVLKAADALFVSPGAPNYDYSIQYSFLDPTKRSPAAQQGISISGVPLDINQSTRGSPPDLGAYEAPPLSAARDEVATYDPGSGLWQIRNSNTSGFANLGMFTFGLGGNNSFPVVGHWNGYGLPGVGVVEVIDSTTAGQGKVLTWKLRNTLTPGTPDVAQFAFGAQGDIPVVGDWDGNGTTTVGIYQSEAEFGNAPGTWKLRNRNAAGAPDYNSGPGQNGFAFGGLPGDLPVTGDWNGDGTTTVGIVERYQSGVLNWRLRNSNSAGSADAGSFAFGSSAASQLPVPGVGWVTGVADSQPVTGAWTTYGSSSAKVGVIGASGKWSLTYYIPAPNSMFNFNPFPSAVFNFAEGQCRPLAADFDGLP